MTAPDVRQPIVIRPPFRKLAIAAASGFLVTGVALVLVLALGPDLLARAAVATAAGWVLPLVAGSVTAAVAWALVRGTSSRGTSCEWKAPGSVCPECGGVVRVDWRLCPHCGQRIMA